MRLLTVEVRTKETDIVLGRHGEGIADIVDHAIATAIQQDYRLGELRLTWTEEEWKAMAGLD